MHCLYVLGLLLSLFLLAQGASRGVPPEPVVFHFSVILTGRGAITGVQVGSKWELREMDYTASATQQWHIHKSTAAPYSYFISMRANRELVWDTQGNKFVAGTPIVLFNKKYTSPAENKNQRWETKDNKFAIIYDNSMVANVTQSGQLVLAKKTSSLYQNFKTLDVHDWWEYELVNYHTGPVMVSAVTPVGNKDLGVVDANKTILFNLFNSSLLSVKDLNGTVLPTLPITASSLIRVPPLVIPDGARSWSGFFTNNKTVNATTMTLSFNRGHITGSGSYEFRSFSVSGSYYAPEGGIYMLFSPGNIGFFGRFDGPSTTMFGTWSHSGTTQGTFQFTLV